MNATATKLLPDQVVEKLEEKCELKDKLQDVRDAGMKKVEKLTDRVEDAMLEANRTARRFRFAAEDKLDQGRYQIKQNPVAAVAIAGVAGIFLGFLAGSLFKSKRSKE
jgi:ElaB/YqjD/DUF883 family membrane-anchored ribosome-binding protein